MRLQSAQWTFVDVDVGLAAVMSAGFISYWVVVIGDLYYSIHTLYSSTILTEYSTLTAEYSTLITEYSTLTTE